MRTTFTATELETLRAEFSKIDRVCPDRLPQIHAIFDSAHNDAIKQLASSGVKFMSKLAANECVRRGISLRSDPAQT